MIIYGSRMYGRKQKVNGWGHCDHCGKYGRNASYTGRKWGHLYFIPLIPEGVRSRVIMECKACSHGRHLPEKEVPDLIKSLRATYEAALGALREGDDEFVTAEVQEPRNCTGFIAGSLPFLYALAGEGPPTHVLKALQGVTAPVAQALAQGHTDEFLGNFEAAAANYQRAIAAAPEDPLPLHYLGSLHCNRGKHELARGPLEKARKLVPQDLGILQQLIDLYTAMKAFPELAEVYETAFEIVPELTGDKKLTKPYQKACKKAGKQPKF